eukprot:m.1566929 g.1566929  ORF g.1566929 m.1566929 type:complete len:66 (-) comp25295_c0_seq13:6705-6902(-)
MLHMSKRGNHACISLTAGHQVRRTLGLPSNPFALSTPDGAGAGIRRRFSGTVFTRTAEEQAMDEE